MEDLGFKRICMFCGTKFYDFNKSPIVCPKCGETFDPLSMFKKRSKTKENDDELTIDSLGLGDDIDLDDAIDDGILDDDADALSEDDVSEED